MYGFSDIRLYRQNFLSFWVMFYPPNNPKKSKSWKKKEKKNVWRYYFTYGAQQTNFFSHFRPFFSLMMYGSWNMKRDRHIFLSFCTIFFSFVPIATQNIKILKKWRKSWRCHHFSQVDQKSWSYAILFLKYGVWRITAIFNLGYFLSFYLPNSLKNQS